jgi:hypothetical protein
MRVDLLAGENLFHLLTQFGIPIREWVHEAISKKTVYSGNSRLGERFINIRLIPILGGDKVMRLIVLGQDFTEQRHAEEQVRELTRQLEHKVRERTEELEKLNQKLTQDRQRAELLANLSQRLIEEAQDYHGLLKYIMQELSELIGDACLIALFTSDRTLVEVMAISDRDPDDLELEPVQLIHQTIPVDTSPIFSSILNGKRYSAKDIAPENLADIFPALFTVNLGKRVLSDLEVYPLQTSDQPLGALAIFKKQGQPYSTDEISDQSDIHDNPEFSARRAAYGESNAIARSLSAIGSGAGKSIPSPSEGIARSPRTGYDRHQHQLEYHSPNDARIDTRKH